MPRPFDLKKLLAPVGDIVRKLNNRRQQLMSEVELIDGQLARFNGKGRRKRIAGVPRMGRKKRVRRNRPELEAQAQQVVDFIKGAGKAGLSGQEIKVKFGITAPSLKAYLKQYAPGARITTIGKQRSMRYMI
jgi:hypothetical protein